MNAVSNPTVQLVQSHASDQAEIQPVNQTQPVGEKQQPQLEALDEEQQPDVFPGDHGALAAWLILLGAFVSLFPAFGFMVSIGTLQGYWQRYQLADYTSRDIGWIPSVFVYLLLARGIVVGPLFDRFGSRWIL